MLDVSVVVPARNAAPWLDACLTAIERGEPAEVIVVDGCSTDDTVRIARAHGAHVLSDEGRGLAPRAALGVAGGDAASASHSSTPTWCSATGRSPRCSTSSRPAATPALQAGLHSVGGPGYWGRALAHHHRTGRSVHWFGLVATIFYRARCCSEAGSTTGSLGRGHRAAPAAARAGARLGVSERTVVHPPLRRRVRIRARPVARRRRRAGAHRWKEGWRAAASSPCRRWRPRAASR